MAVRTERDRGEKDRSDILEERRRLLEYVLETHKARGGRVQLPIGMNAPEPWLLDALDVKALLPALHHGGPGARVDLLDFCRRGRTAAAELTRSRSRDGGAAAAAAPGDAAAAPGEREAPVLDLPQLAMGLADSELKDLAYLLVAANCQQGMDEDLLATVRGHLGVDSARGDEVSRLLALVSNTFTRVREATGSLPVSDQWTANLELPVCLLGVVLPKDFKRFRSFVVWRDTLSHVLLTTLAQSVREGWAPPAQVAGTAPPSAQALMARLKASLRRCDARDADDFDEAEYRCASRDAGQHTQAIAKCTAAGWAFPWGLRVRLCEVLLRGVFDSLDESSSSYIDDADDYLRLLQARLWPLLGVSPSMHNACFAWVHFRQFVVTRSPGMVGKAKALLKRLASLARQQAAEDEGGGEGGGGGGGAPVAPQDAALTRQVGSAVIGWISERLADYHERLPALGGPDSLPGLVDILCFAAATRGDSAEDVCGALADAVASSVEKELDRRIGRQGPFASEAEACAAACDAIGRLAQEQRDTWARGFSGPLPEAVPVALAVLHGAAGARVLPWLGRVSGLDEQTCAALRAALELEPQLLGPLEAATGACRHPTIRIRLEAARSWDTPSQLQPVLATWVEKQISGFGLWVDRQLQQETWQPLGERQPHASSARELRRIVLESLDALFGLGLPLPPSIVGMHMEGVDGMMHRYLQAVLDRLGPWGAMVPPLPCPARYKKEIAVKQEEAEAGLPGLPLRLPPPGSVGRRHGLPFLESTRRAEQEPACARLQGLSSEVLVVMLASLGYLLDTLEPIAAAVADKWHEECVRQKTTGAAGPGAHANGGSSLGGDSSAGGYENPFLTPSGSSGGRNGARGAAQQQQQQQPAGDTWGGCWGLGAAPRTGGGGAPALRCRTGGGSFSQHAGEMFGAMLESAGQSLRGGLGAVTKWLAVRVVWWEQRAGWCELLYRHRVTACRIDWLLDGLGQVLGGPLCLLPRAPRLDVAAALLREAALALERALLDGGPCRWFVPADVAHLAEDVDGLRRLFFADGDGLSMQDVNASLAGVTALLALMLRPTAQLVEAHRAVRRAGGLPDLNVGASSAGPTGASSAPAWGPGSGGGGGSPRGGAHGRQPVPLGPFLSARTTSSSPRTAGAAAGGATGGGGLLGGGSPRGPLGGRATGGGSGGRSGAGSPRGAEPGAGAWGQRQRTAMAIVAAGGDLGTHEHVLLRVLCHRADHAASKYLKDSAKLPKVRDETIGEAFGRLKRLTRI